MHGQVKLVQDAQCSGRFVQLQGDLGELQDDFGVVGTHDRKASPASVASKRRIDNKELAAEHTAAMLSPASTTLGVITTEMLKSSSSGTARNNPAPPRTAPNRKI